MNNNLRNTVQPRQRGANSEFLPPPPRLTTEFSTPAVQDSSWCSQDFMLGAGMVLIQDKTQKIVIIYEKQKKYWFFPRGRKDIGESLEQTALREAYEESGYRAEFLPLFAPHHAPAAPHDLNAYNRPDTEPIFISLTSWQPRRRRGFPDNGGEYLTSWYVGRIAENAISQPGTGMPDEQDYESYLVSFEDAWRHLFGTERKVLEYAWTLYRYTLRKLSERETGQGLTSVSDS